MTDFDDFDDDFELDFDDIFTPEGDYEGKIESAEYKVNEEKGSVGINFTLALEDVDGKKFKYLYLQNKNEGTKSAQGYQELQAIVKAVTGETPSGSWSLKQLDPQKDAKGNVYFEALAGALVKVQVKHRTNKENEKSETFRILAAD